MERKELEKYYQAQADDMAGEVAERRRLGLPYATGEIISFVAAFICFAISVVHNMQGAWLIAALACLVLYIYLRNKDGKNTKLIRHFEDLEQVYRHELCYLKGDFTPFDDGSQFVNPAHPFSFDMDIFGPESLFQRINRTVTSGGRARLAEILSSLNYDAERSEALTEWASDEKAMAAFKAIGQGGTLHTEQLMAGLKEAESVSMPAYVSSKLFMPAIWLLRLSLLAAFALAACNMVSWNLPIWWLILQFFIVYLLSNNPLKKLSSTLTQLAHEAESYAETLRVVGKMHFEAPENQRLQATLQRSATFFRQLSTLLHDLDKRGNILGIFVLDALGLRDMVLMHHVWRWKQAYRGMTHEWIEALSEADALVSMATFRLNEPEARPANVVESDRLVYDGKGLWHPFLGARAVRNDFKLADRHYYIITGANMAGKSTFLRTLGINYILAINGLPVFADELTVSRFSLFTSMRTSDSLTQGISYFDAELLRLEQLLEFCKQHAPVLIILDEILKGTNSADKLNGSRLFLEHVYHQNVTGVIATHDLELSKMADKYPDRIHNYCFEIALADDVTYSYKIAPGTSHNQNATFLLKQMLQRSTLAEE